MPRPAAVSTMSIEDISGFEDYPRQVQSLVQSALALTHLELGYLYGSHEPAKGGMDCSGTVYHVLKFQGLKDVPRQSDEMCQWVEKKTQLHLTPTATSFDSAEFAALKPGDLLFWTNTTETKRKLPVTHVMIYLGKQKKTGKRIVFGASDGRSFEGQRRSGVSVFDFHLPKPEGTTHFHGYGAAPGLLPAQPEPVIIAASSKPVEKPVTIEKTAPQTVAKPEAKEEVRKAVAIANEPAAASERMPDPKKVIVVVPASKSEAATKTEDSLKSSKTETKPELKKTVAASTTAKPKSTSTSKSSSASSATRRKTPPAPPKSQLERSVDNAVNSVRRFFRQ
ncbi:MAG: C40 family peptidase [Prosthecobacter sp.]|uniref:C40 family peptidase n=1 Tax=Prosthecobacter sp. TaxID=1965333 RepID=UPI0019DF4DAB|nr:NlpC/P60 family protein [Prosthecobacter sp.]MBE2284190.1 C40 family peptidase [Prosthecobacter sp.]